MLRRLLGLAVVFAVLLVACGGDSTEGTEATASPSTQGTGPESEPEPSSSVTTVESESEEPGAASLGEGTVVIGDETFTIRVDMCVIEAEEQGGSVLIGGPASGNAGDSGYASIEYHDRSTSESRPSVLVGVGATSSFDVENGDPVYNGSLEANFGAEINGAAEDLGPDRNAHIAGTLSFRIRGGSDSMDGSVDVICHYQ